MRPARTPSARPPVAAVAVLLLLCASPLGALTLDPTVDGILLGVGVTLGGGSELLDLLKWPPAGASNTEVFPPSQLDISSMFPYSRDADVASSFFETATLAVPLVFVAASSQDQALASGVAYAESLSFAMAAKNGVKTLTPRLRPYTYSGGAPGVDTAEDDKSFPSGHATVAFAAAGFSTYLLLQGYPNSAWFLPLVVTDYGLAFLTASYRVYSGMHFVTDVLAGAVIGTLCGFLLPSIAHKP